VAVHAPSRSPQTRLPPAVRPPTLDMFLPSPESHAHACTGACIERATWSSCRPKIATGCGSVSTTCWASAGTFPTTRYSPCTFNVRSVLFLEESHHHPHRHDAHIALPYAHSGRRPITASHVNDSQRPIIDRLFIVSFYEGQHCNTLARTRIALTFIPSYLDS
jgi:hypothetical protein